MVCKVCRHRGTSRHVGPCACNSRGTLLNVCWEPLCSAGRGEKEEKRYSESDNRNLLVLGGEGGEKAKHLRNSSKAAGIVGGVWRWNRWGSWRNLCVQQRVNLLKEKERELWETWNYIQIWEIMPPFHFVIVKISWKSQSVFLPLFFFLWLWVLSGKCWNTSFQIFQNQSFWHLLK